MKTDDLKKAYKAKLDAIESLEETIGEAAPTEEQNLEYEGMLAEAKSLARSIDNFNAAEELRVHATKSSGSAVAQMIPRQAFPGEGDIDGVTAKPDTGEMFAWKSVGEEKLKALKSADYLDGLDAYIRAKSIFGEDWRSHMKGGYMKVLNEGQDTAGGFWIPPDFRNQLITKIATTTAIRPNATVITTARDVVTFPAVTYTADDKYTSGVRFAWQGANAKAAAVAESTNPIAGTLKIPVHLAVAKILVQRDQMEDNGFDILGFVTQKMTESFGLGAEDAYINGDGIGQPEGLATHPTFGIANGSTGVVAGLTVAGGMVKSGVSAKVTWQGSSNDEPTLGILGMNNALPPQYEPGAKWYAAKQTYTEIAGIRDTAQRPLWWNMGGNAEYPGIVHGFPAELIGYPIERSQFFAVPNASSHSLYLGDMGAYYIVDRVALSVEVYRETYADRDQVMVYARMRTGGQLVDYWRMKVLELGT